MKNKICILALCFIMLFTGCGNKHSSDIENKIDINVKKNDNININILTTDKLLYFMTKDIVKEKHFVEYMFKNRQDEINFTYSKDSLNNVAKQDLFFYNGAGLEPWANEFLDKLNKSRVGVINVSRGINLLGYTKQVKYKDSILKDNPYYWLNIDNYKIALLNIKNSLQDKDPKNGNYYEENFSNQLKQIQKYEKEIREISTKLKDYAILYNEDELDYFIKYSNFNALRAEEEEKNNFKDIEAQLKEKKVIFLYNDKKQLEENKETIKKYNIKYTNLLLYKENENYIKLLEYNIHNLNALIEKL
ncbi:metal ABC transporter substrate-binding protein [Clostridium rectalis]|uniref:metal ABC transporter substrate-binding protein n=1 Tax=Clostridium rectalis TaxID=2040295 RepID=UPI000F63BC7E|nr:metal ABC transporter substrate-binding protein [Clostridium rectalis]